jgi:hypothetical protein
MGNFLESDDGWRGANIGFVNDIDGVDVHVLSKTGIVLVWFKDILYII